MKTEEQRQALVYLTESNTQFIGSYLRATQLNTDEVRAYMTSVITHVVLFWTSVYQCSPVQVASVCRSQEVMQIMAQLARGIKEADDLGQLWYRSVEQLIQLFQFELPDDVAQCLQELSYIQAILVVQFMRFAKDPERMELLVF